MPGTCRVKPGWKCDQSQFGAASTCTPVCGDGMRLGDEVCDDGNVASGDGCSGLAVAAKGSVQAVSSSSSCRAEMGRKCRSAGPGGKDTCTAVCGDGQRADPEVCDDGNTAGGDGCSAGCDAFEDGFECVSVPGGGHSCAPETGVERLALEAVLRLDMDAGWSLTNYKDVFWPSFTEDLGTGAAASLCLSLPLSASLSLPFCLLP